MRGMGYVRFSTDKQASTAEQMAAIEKYCRKNDIELVGFQVDESLTGTNTNREGFQKIMAAAKEHAFDAVIIYDITRGSRDVADWFNFRKDMQQYGIRVISTMDRLGDINDPNDFLTELLSVGIGQHLVLTTRIKSMDGISTRAESGKFCGGYPPLGYQIKDGNYEIDEQEARAVRQIFAMYAAGSSYKAIITWLAHEGYRGKRGRPIGQNSLYEILRNERYIGTYSWNKRQVKYMSKWAGGKRRDDAIIIEDAIPRIIDQDTWMRVKERMENNKKNITNKSSSNREYLLAGLLRCAKCGGTFVGVTTTNKKGIEYKFYSCGNKKRLHNCDAKNIAANDIEPLLVNMLKHALTNGRIIENTADMILQSRDGRNSQLVKLDQELLSIEQKIENIIKSLEDGLDSSSLRTRLIENEQKKKALETQIKGLKGVQAVNRDDIIAAMREDAQRAIDEPACMKELLRKYFTKVEIGDDEITIHAVCDLGEYEDKEKSLENFSKDLTTNGCGGRI